MSQENAAAEKKMSNRQIANIVISVLLVISMIAFVIQNYNKIKIEFFMWEFRFRIIYLMLISFAAGVFSTFAFKRYWKNRKKK